MEPDSQQQVRAIQGAVNLGMFWDASWGPNDLRQCNSLYLHVYTLKAKSLDWKRGIHDETLDFGVPFMDSCRSLRVVALVFQTMLGAF